MTGETDTPVDDRPVLASNWATALHLAQRTEMSSPHHSLHPQLTQMFVHVFCFQMQQLQAAAAAQTRRSAAPRSARPLLVGLQSSEAALQAQRRNLDRFVQDHAAEYAAFPYRPWTQATRKLGVKTTVGPSQLPGCVGLRGVKLAAAITTGDRELQLLYYSGLLMSEQMYQQFHAEYYCPTALELPALAFLDNSGQRQNVLIVGDPTSHGAIINDGVHSGLEGQLRSVAQHCEQLSSSGC